MTTSGVLPVKRVLRVFDERRRGWAQPNRYDIDAPVCVLQLMLAQVGMCQSRQLLLLDGANTLERRRSCATGTRAHPDKNQRCAMPGDNVNLALTATPVRFDNAIAALM